MASGGSSDHLLALTTLPDVEGARRLVHYLLERRLVACGTILPGATSVYRWEGAVEESGEVQVLLKTRRDRWPELEAALRRHHPYEVPELLAVAVAAGLPAYLQWVTAEVTPPGESTT